MAPRDDVEVVGGDEKTTPVQDPDDLPPALVEKRRIRYVDDAEDMGHH